MNFPIPYMVMLTTMSYSSKPSKLGGTAHFIKHNLLVQTRLCVGWLFSIGNNSKLCALFLLCIS